MSTFELRSVQRLYSEAHTQTSTHNQSKNSVWTRGSQLTLDREEEEEVRRRREWARWRQGEKEQVSGVIGSFFKQTRTEEWLSVHHSSWEGMLCACKCVHVSVCARARWGWRPRRPTKRSFQMCRLVFHSEKNWRYQWYLWYLYLWSGYKYDWLCHSLEFILSYEISWCLANQFKHFWMSESISTCYLLLGFHHNWPVFIV